MVSIGDWGPMHEAFRTRGSSLLGPCSWFPRPLRSLAHARLATDLMRHRKALLVTKTMVGRQSGVGRGTWH